jgi:hypothetical protein
MAPTDSGTALSPQPLRLAQFDAEATITPRDRRAERPSRDRPALRLVRSGLPVLIAGSDSPRRAALLLDLRESLSEGTVFEELNTLAELLERAPASRMVIVDGQLDGIPGSALVHILAQRHPSLPVISLDLQDPDDL